MTEGYKQTEIGVIPEDWEVKHLPDYGDVLGGGTPSTSVSAYWSGNIAWCTPSDITATKEISIIKTEKNISEQGLVNCQTKCNRNEAQDPKGTEQKRSEEPYEAWR